jgi:hypothetical protein
MQIARRNFLRTAAALAGLPLLAGCRQVLGWGLPVEIIRPGMAEGHRLRDATTLPPARSTPGRYRHRRQRCAGLFAGWQLVREGYRDFVVLNGPEPDGNAAAGAFGEWRYPTGAHYLPLPSSESAHVRALLVEMGVIESGSDSLRPALTNGCWCTRRTNGCGGRVSGRMACYHVVLAPTKMPSSSAFFSMSDNCSNSAVLMAAACLPSPLHSPRKTRHGARWTGKALPAGWSHKATRHPV